MIGKTGAHFSNLWKKVELYLRAGAGPMPKRGCVVRLFGIAISKKRFVSLDKCYRYHVLRGLDDIRALADRVRYCLDRRQGVGSMKRYTWVFALSAVVIGPTYAANLLVNPGFEEGDGLVATNWWTYGAAGRVNWANRKPEWGAYGYAFFAAGNEWGGFGQDIAVDLSKGNIFRFAISAKAETHYTNENTTVGLEFWNGSTLAYAVTQNVYFALATNRNQWTYLMLEHTNTVPTVTTVKVRCDFADGTIPAGTPSATCQWDDGRLWQIQERPARAPSRAKYEPPSGVYLGALLERGGASNQIVELNQKAGKRHAVYAKFILFQQDPFPWEWIRAVTSACPGAALHLILEPMVGFTNFYQPDWGPGQATYEAALEFVTNCAAVNAPIFLRFAHEANGDWYPWHPAFSERYGLPDDVTPETYITAYRRFAELVHSNAPNVAMVWAPNQGNGPDPLPYYEDVYPGDEYVDWVGLSVYNGWSYGNSNEVLDFQFRNAVEQGYWQENDDPYDDTFENFYWVFSDPRNPRGHQKPMMIAETAAAFEPRYAITGEVVFTGFESLDGPQYMASKLLAQFQSLNDDGFALTNTLFVDAFEAIGAWNWGPWGNLFWSNSADAVEGTNAVRIGGMPSGGYVGGNGRSIAVDWNWSSSDAMELWVKCDAATNPFPSLGIELRSGILTTYVFKTVTSTSYYPLRIPFSEMTNSAAFDWSNVQAVVFHLVSGGETRPRDLWVDAWTRGVLTNSSYVDQDWWPQGPALTPWVDGSDTSGGWHTWQLVNEPAPGFPSQSLRMAGYDANSNNYIGGNGFTVRSADRDWSGLNSFAVTVRRADATNADPVLVVSFRDASETRTAQVSVVVVSTNYVQQVVPLEDMTVTTGFDWSNVAYVVFEMLSGAAGARPSDLLVKEFSLGMVSNITEADWWPAGPGYQPWGDSTWTQTPEAAVGAFALQVAGVVTNSEQWYIGGNGCSLPIPQQDWSPYNALVLYARRGDVPGRVQPKFKLTLDNDYAETNGNEAVIETKVANTEWYEMVIPFEDFIADAGFAWTNVKMFKIEYFTGEAGRQPNDLFLDHVRWAVATLTNGADNLKWKRDWIHQLYSLENFQDADPANPDYVSIFERFPNIHMINWFHVKKFEDGFTKDLRIVEDGTNAIAFASYYERIRNDYFLTNVVRDSTGTGISDEWIIQHFGGLGGFDPQADPDGDGANNAEEYTAGTDPTNNASALILNASLSISPLPSFTLQWSGGAFRHYQVQSRTNLLHGAWESWAWTFSVTGSLSWTENTLTDDVRFYRVNVMP